MDHLFSLQKGEDIRNLDPMKELCQALGSPEKAFSTIHVAGTNGKGSVCEKMARALQEEGYRVGLYTSPHLQSFCERIRINQEPIREEKVVSLYQKIKPFLKTRRTFFEIATLMGFLHFKEEKVDVAVIETGLGGRLDATNVIEPLLSIITSIGYDHRHILGSSLEEIAREKGGILKSKIPAVIGPSVQLSWIESLVKEKKCPLYQTKRVDGSFEEENQQIARIALQLLSQMTPLKKSSIEKGILAKPFCRFEVIEEVEGVILDAAHNVSALERLIESLEQSYPNRPLRFICGFCKDKEIDRCAKKILEKASFIHLVSSRYPRVASTTLLEQAFTSKIVPIQSEGSMAEAIKRALKDRIAEEVIVITGSFYLLKDAKEVLQSI